MLSLESLNVLFDGELCSEDFLTLRWESLDYIVVIGMYAPEPPPTRLRHYSAGSVAIRLYINLAYCVFRQPASAGGLAGAGLRPRINIDALQ